MNFKLFIKHNPFFGQANIFAYNLQYFDLSHNNIFMNDPTFFGFIPARYASTRFPGKPLALIMGKPMFWHVYNQTIKCPLLANTYLATDDERIAQAAHELKVPYIMTTPSHPSGSDRIFEAACKLNVPNDAVLVNIQGDEPALDPNMLTALLKPFCNDPSVQVSTLAHPISAADAENENLVKIAMDLNNNALYFSRAPIPHIRQKHENTACPEKEFWGHIGLYAFKFNTLKQFVGMPPSPLELREGLEQLRFLEHGIPIRVALSNYLSSAVDVPEDIAKVEALLLAKNNLQAKPAI